MSVRVYRYAVARGGPWVFEVVCDEHELSKEYHTRLEAEDAAEDHENERHER